MQKICGLDSQRGWQFVKAYNKTFIRWQIFTPLCAVDVAIGFAILTVVDQPASYHQFWNGVDSLIVKLDEVITSVRTW